MEENVIVAFVSVVLALRRPRNTPRMVLGDPGDASTKGKKDPVNPSCTRRNVLGTLNVHFSVRGCPSKTRSGLGGWNVMVGSCNSVVKNTTGLDLGLSPLLTSKNVRGTSLFRASRGMCQKRRPKTHWSKTKTHRSKTFFSMLKFL